MIDPSSGGRKPASTRTGCMNKSLSAGFLGAVAVTAANQLGKWILPAAPRLDVLGMRLASRAMQKAKVKPLSGGALYAVSFLGEMISNSLFYALVGLGSPRTAWLRGSLLGLSAGLAAVALPEPLGVGESPTARTEKTRLMTILWYMLGGLIAALTYGKLNPKR
jgi:hypothetical protein